MNRFRLDAAATFLIAGLAFALSYSQLADLAARAGYGSMSYIWPLSVDGLAVVATAAVMRLRSSNHYAWFLLTASTAVSVVAAAGAHILPPGPLPGWAAAAVVVVPALCLPLALHLAVQLRRDAAGASRETAGAAREVGAAATHAPATDEVEAATEATVASEAIVAADQPRRTTAQPELQRDALFEMPAPTDAPQPMTRDEMRARMFHLLATTSMSQRDVAKEIGTSEATVRRWRKEGDAADAAPALAAVGG